MGGSIFPGMRIALGLLLASTVVLSIELRNITVYHVNPADVGAIPVNMDTGDARGDLYFYLSQFLLPMECKPPYDTFRAKFDCANPEREGSKLVVTKVNMEVNADTT